MSYFFEYCPFNVLTLSFTLSLSLTPCIEVAFWDNILSFSFIHTYISSENELIFFPYTGFYFMILHPPLFQLKLLCLNFFLNYGLPTVLSIVGYFTHPTKLMSIHFFFLFFKSHRDFHFMRTLISHHEILQWNKSLFSFELFSTPPKNLFLCFRRFFS